METRQKIRMPQNFNMMLMKSIDLQTSFEAGIDRRTSPGYGFFLVFKKQLFLTPEIY
jgi:hypothetical protein